MKHQKNPYQLTKKQHVFPAKSLARFADTSDNRLAVRLLCHSKEIRVLPSNEVFCAMRVWDHGGERGTKHIEDKFQAVADQICTIRRSLEDDQHLIVTEFFALWAARAELKANPIGDVPLIGVTGKQMQYTRDEQEMLEKNNIGYINEDLTMPGHQLASGVIMIRIGDYKRQHPRQRWGVVYSRTLEFIVPDQFGGKAIVPVTPRLCLVADSPNNLASEQEVRMQNHVATRVARDYIAARSFADCGL